MAFPGGGGVRLRGSRASERAQQAARSAGRVPLSSLLAESDEERDINFGLPVAGSTPDGGPPKTGADLIRDGVTIVEGNPPVGGGPGPGAGFAGSRESHPSYRADEWMSRIGSRGGSSSTGSGGGSSSGGQWDDYLDPQSAAWLRSLFTPTDVAAQEAQARANSEAALGRAQADLEARGGMAGMGLAGGQIAMGSDLQRQAAQQLTDQILGIQDAAAQRDLQRGTIAAEFLDRGVQRGQEDEWTLALLEALGLGEEDAPPSGGDAPDMNKPPEEHERLADRYADVPFNNDFGAAFGFGDHPVARYRDPDTGKIIVVRRRQDGSMYKTEDINQFG